MRKQLEISTPTSCLNKSADHEPIFVLCARDPSAPGAVRQWANAYKRRKVAANQFFDAAIRKHREALVLADNMELWRDAQREDAGIATKVRAGIAPGPESIVEREPVGVLPA